MYLSKQDFEILKQVNTMTMYKIPYQELDDGSQELCVLFDCLMVKLLRQQKEQNKKTYAIIKEKRKSNKMYGRSKKEKEKHEQAKARRNK